MVFADGTEHAATNMSIYYRKPVNSTVPVIPIPIGLRTIEGNPNNTTGPSRALWNCNGGAFGGFIPGAACTGSVQASVYMAQCWDGNELDNAMHHTIVPCTGANGTVAGPGQITLPQIQFIVTYPAGSGGGRLESDADAGTSGGRTFHVDYWFAGDPYAWSKVDERCLNAGFQCRVVGKLTQWPEGSIVNISVSPFQVVLTAAEAKGLNP
jgi:hypothetical protein